MTTKELDGWCRTRGIKNLLLTHSQVALLLGVSEKALYQKRKDGTGPPALSIGRIRYKRTEVVRWINEQEVMRENAKTYTSAEPAKPREKTAGRRDLVQKVRERVWADLRFDRGNKAQPSGESRPRH